MEMETDYKTIVSMSNPNQADLDGDEEDAGDPDVDGDGQQIH